MLIATPSPFVRDPRSSLPQPDLVVFFVVKSFVAACFVVVFTAFSVESTGTEATFGDACGRGFGARLLSRLISPMFFFLAAS